MKLTTYFLKHPVIALILNAMIIIMGVLCFNSLSIREYPEVRFPTVSVRAFYPNASAEIVETAVTNVLEDQLAGVEGVETITSKSKYGGSIITLNFRSGTSIDRALIAIREAIGLARGQLPQEVKEPIVERQAVSDAMPFIIVSLESSSMDFAALTHYANLNLKNAFRSNKGVGSVEVWGQPYTYNITLDAKKLYSFGVNVDDIYDTLLRSNVSLPIGKFRDETPVTLNTELKTVADYENVIIKNNSNKLSIKNQQIPVLLKDVATISLKTDNTRFRVRINGKPGLCIAINRTNDGNPLEVSTLIRQQVANLQPTLPSGLKMAIISDQADFVRSSLKNIQSSIIEAIIFVLIIVFLFLRNIKATLIPLVTIPISLLGSLLFLKIFGFSINIITLMAMVLAVGLVVDDAIVVLENIQRHIENGLSTAEAAIKGANEIGFAIVAMTLTLTSVYAPLAFIYGTVGQLFTEFAVALAGSVLISGVVALTLSPLMCSKTLTHNASHLWPTIDNILGNLSSRYQHALTIVLHYKKACLFIIVIALASIWALTKMIPSEMAPKEDRGLVGVYIPPIPGKDINTMEEKINSLDTVLEKIPEAQNRLIFMGDWGGSIVMPLKPKAERHRSADEILEYMRPLVKIPSIEVHAWSWDSALPGMDDTMNGSELSLVISTTSSYRSLFNAIEKARLRLDNENLFTGVRHDLTLDTPGYRIDLNNNNLSLLNLNARQVAKTIEVFFSGDQSLTFFKDGISYAISIKSVTAPWSLNELYLTNPAGERISLGAVANMTFTAEPQKLFHYNQMRSVILTTDLKSDDKIEKAMPLLLKTLNHDLPSDYKKTWTGAAKAYSESKTTMLTLFLLALIFIFAILAVQFENFIDPFIILLTVPLACSGALLLVWMLGQSINIYTQVGLITLIGLITKHGILIVEFANQLLADKKTLVEATIQAATLRLRPILMTTGAMIFGAIPLVLSHDAGFESRRAIGTILIGGLTIGTFFTLFVLPTLYLIIKSYTHQESSQI